MEININFSVPSGSTAEDISAILSRVMFDIAKQDAQDYFGPGDFEVYRDGECVATYSVLQEHDGEDCFPYNCHDFSDDADALASAGFGMDEDYGGWAYDCDEY